MSCQATDDSKLHFQAFIEHNCLTGTILNDSIVVEVSFNLET